MGGEPPGSVRNDQNWLGKLVGNPRSLADQGRKLRIGEHFLELADSSIDSPDLPAGWIDPSQNDRIPSIRSGPVRNLESVVGQTAKGGREIRKRSGRGGRFDG